MIGTQYEHFSLQSLLYLWGTKNGDIISGQSNYDEVTNIGKEKSLSFFIQDKHYFRPEIILNVGFRYDFKYRQEEDVVKTFSPRLALLYVPHEHFSLKLSYAEAFADLSFYNRYLYKTDNFSMNPQHLSAIQLTAIGAISPLHLNYEANLFYNKYSSLMCLLSRDEYTGKNSGKLTNWGVECSANYAYKRFSSSLSLYYCKDIDSEHYYYNTSQNIVCGVPHFAINLHGAWKLIQGEKHELKVYGHSKYMGRKLSFQKEEEDDFFVEGKLLFDLGITYRYKQHLQLSLDGENIFNTYHYLCGYTYLCAPDFQRGRTLMASLSYQF